MTTTLGFQAALLSKRAFLVMQSRCSMALMFGDFRPYYSGRRCTYVRTRQLVQVVLFMAQQASPSAEPLEIEEHRNRSLSSFVI